MNRRKLSTLTLLVLLVSIGVTATTQFGFLGDKDPPADIAHPVSAVQAEPGTREMHSSASDMLLHRWSAHVQQVYGTSPEDWARAMRPTLARMTQQDLRHAADMPSFEQMMAALTAQPAQLTPVLTHGDRLVQAGPLLQTDARQLAYNMVVPCRLVDTRNVNAKIQAGFLLHMNSAGTSFAGQGGSATTCGVPAGAEAVVLNVTAVNAGDDGYLTLFPYGTTLPLASSLNYYARQTAGNEIIVKQSQGQEAAISIYSFASTDVVIDVVGYFVKGLPNRLLCWNESIQFELPPLNYTSIPVYCPSLWFELYRSATVGGSCRWIQNGIDDQAPGQLIGDLGGGRYSCEADNQSNQYRQFVTTAICCRVVPQGVD